MSTRRILWVAALLGAISAPVFAQTPQPSKPAAPAVTTPAKPANPTTPAPVVNKINLNTATATELDTLPQIGPARAKAIVEARVKGKFKNWDDFVARKVVPSNAEFELDNRLGGPAGIRRGDLRVVARRGEAAERAKRCCRFAELR